MPSHLYLEERRRHILDLLKNQGRVSVLELSETLNVSGVTIRQDLKSLEDEGLLERTHGGAVAPSQKPNSEGRELSFELRRVAQSDEKDALGRAAAALVQTGSAIALDASTTVCSIIPHLSLIDRYSIITNNLIVPELVLARPQVDVYLSGGRFRRDSYSVTGNPQYIPDINLNIGFLSAWGISIEAGLTEVNQGEMEMKLALLARCRMKVLLVDSSKWGKIAPYTYARPNDFDLIITTNRASDSYLRQFSGINIQIVAV